MIKQLPPITICNDEDAEVLLGALNIAEITANIFRHDIAYISIVLNNVPPLNDALPFDFGRFYFDMEQAINEAKNLRARLEERGAIKDIFEIPSKDIYCILNMFNAVIGIFMELHMIALQVFPLIEASNKDKEIEFKMADFEKILFERYNYINYKDFKSAYGYFNTDKWWLINQAAHSHTEISTIH